jgi:hypothetical protein
MTFLHAIIANRHIRQRNSQTIDLYKTEAIHGGGEEEEKVTEFLT